jgi:hypothetical protein
VDTGRNRTDLIDANARSTHFLPVSRVHHILVGSRQILGVTKISSIITFVPKLKNEKDDDKMTPWSKMLKQAATSTAKGSAITLGSTVFACVVACYIEVGAHRLLYLCCPHKYAHVEYANGLSQEQLDAVKPHGLKPKLETDMNTPTNQGEWRYRVQNNSSASNTRGQESRSDDTVLLTEASTTSTSTRFTTEFPSSSLANDLLSCSMTG